MKPILHLLALTLFAPLAPAAEPPLPRPEGEAFLEELAASRPDGKVVEVDFVETREIAALKEPVTLRGTLRFLPPHQFRREVTSPEQTVTVSDGETLWIYDPEFAVAERYALDSMPRLRDAMRAIAAGLEFRSIDRNFRWTIWKLNGGFRILLEPKQPAMQRMIQRLVLLLDTRLQLTSSEVISAEGERTFTRFSNERISAAKPGEFDFTPPAGVTITEPLGR